MRQRASEHCDPWTESRTLPHPITSSVFQRQVFCNPQPSDRKARPFFHHICLRQMLLLSSLTAITAVSGRMSGERVICVCFFLVQLADHRRSYCTRQLLCRRELFHERMLWFVCCRRLRRSVVITPSLRRWIAGSWGWLFDCWGVSSRSQGCVLRFRGVLGSGVVLYS